MSQSYPPPITAVDEGQDELTLKLRIAEVCRKAWRLSQHIQSASELAEAVAAAVVDALQLSAAGIWELDRTASVWRLLGSSGDLDLPQWSLQLAAIPWNPSESDPIGALHNEIQRRVCSGDRSGNWTARPGAVAVDLTGRAHRESRALATWSADLDESLHLIAAESIAHDLSLVFDAVGDRWQSQLNGRLYSVLFDHSPCAIAGIDREGRCTRWNDAAMELFGWDRSEIVGQPLYFIGAACGATFQEAVELCRERVKASNLRLPCQTATGQTLQIEILALPVIDAGARSEVFLVMSDESLNDWRQRLGRSEVEIAALLTSASSVDEAGPQLLQTLCRRMDWNGGELWQVSADGQRWTCSAVWRRCTSATGVTIEPGCSLRIDSGLLGEVYATRQIAGADGDDDTYDRAVPIVCEGDVKAAIICLGTQCLADDEVVRTSLQSIAHQVGQALSRDGILENLRQAEANLQQTRKMEAIGMLAGGVAHDFNNLVMVILGNCEMLQMPSVAADQRADMIEEIRTVGERAATLTRKLLSFSRKRVSDPEALNPARLLRECEGMLERLAVGDIVVEIQVPEAVHAVRIDPIEFEQLLLNLVANARDAMPDGGRITISLANVSLTARDVLPFPDAHAGDFVQLSVADTGCGMDEETQARAFEPFFTTKAQDKGTGFGLATVYGITRRNHGVLKIESAPGKGTRFVICLPRATIGITPRRIDTQPAEDPRGHETVMVVDDEDAVRRIVQRVLEVHGYAVLAADGGASALKMLNRRRQTCDLLLTDVMMPEMKGTQLAQEARILRNGLPVLFMSGYYECAESPNGSSDLPLLMKPFSSDVLVKAVREALDRQTFSAVQ